MELLLIVAIILFGVAALLTLLGVAHPKIQLWALLVASGLACFAAAFLPDLR